MNGVWNSPGRGKPRPVPTMTLFIDRNPKVSSVYRRSRLYRERTASMDQDHQEEVLTDGVWAALERRNISRRDFLRFCSVMTSALALPTRYTSQIVKALEQTKRPALVWLDFQDCAGNSESALRAGHPTFADIVLDLLSWNYHETVMAPSGNAARKRPT